MHLTTDEKYQSSRIKTTLDVVWFKKNLDHLFWLFRWDGSTGVVDLEKVTDVFRFSCKGLVHHHLSSHSWMDIDFLHHFHCPPRRKRMPSARAQREKKVSSLIGLREREREGLIKKGQLLCRDGWWWQSWIVVPQCDQLEVHQHRI